MADITRLVPADLLRILLCAEEVPSVDIVHITVLIIVNAVSWNLTLIHPHVILEVRMSVFNTLIADSNDDTRITCSKSPCILDIDVCTGAYGLSNTEVLIIDVMPLVNEHRVVERKIELCETITLEWFPFRWAFYSEASLIACIVLNGSHIIELCHF